MGGLGRYIPLGKPFLHKLAGGAYPPDRGGEPLLTYLLKFLAALVLT
jgi:hypothetical protein